MLVESDHGWSYDPQLLYVERLAELLRPPAWHADALCAEPVYAGVKFFPTRRGEVLAEAQEVCSRCLARDDCLAAGLEGGEKGVWGGTTEGDRRQLRKGVAA